MHINKYKLSVGSSSTPSMFRLELPDEGATSILPSVVLDIYALSQGSIDGAIQEINTFCDSETKDIVIDHPDYQLQIEKLDPSQVGSLLLFMPMANCLRVTDK